MKESTKIWIIRLIIVGLLSGVAYQWGIPLYRRYLTSSEKHIEIKTMKVKEGAFKVSFHQNGTLEARVSVPVLSEIGGKIIKLVDEGVNVKAGELIAQLDTENTKKEVQDAKLKYENYLAQIKQFENQLNIYREQNKSLITQAQLQLDYDNSELNRVKERRDRKKSLADDKIIARDDVEVVDKVVRAKELTVKIGEMNLEIRGKEAASNEYLIVSYLDTLRSISDIVKMEFDNAEMKMKKSVITAPAAGMVILAQVRGDSGGGQRVIREGDDVSPRNSICQLPDLSTMLIKAQVSESTSPRVLIGMPVLFKLEGVQNKIFHGVVTGIASLATTEDPRTGTARTTGTKTFTVTITIAEKGDRTLKPGMTADAEFLEKSINKAVYIPKSSIIEKNGTTTVFKRIGKSFVNVQVETGIVNDTSVCITKGLKKGDIIALSDPTRNEEEEILSLGSGN
ncbi:MAG: efflux RND transporter periplasmic adaptor subunit [Armatimonadota bacterium]